MDVPLVMPMVPAESQADAPATSARIDAAVRERRSAHSAALRADPELAEGSGIGTSGC
jgi:hypothetical protein